MGSLDFGVLAVVTMLVAGVGCEGERETEARKRARVRARAHATQNRGGSDARPAPIPEPPRYALLPWDTKLYIAPERYTPGLTLMPPKEEEGGEELGRVVRVLGRADSAGRWWEVESVDIEGLGMFEITFYVEAGVGQATEGTESGPSDVLGTSTPLQTGLGRRGNHGEWQVDVGALAFWPTGALAGKVRQRHAYLSQGEVRSLGARSLICFPIRVGPRLEPQTQLCFESDAVVEQEPWRPEPVDEMVLGIPEEDVDLARLLESLEQLEGAYEYGDGG